MIEITPEYLASQGLSKTFPERFWKKVSKDGTCWNWIGCIQTSGYGVINKGSRTPIRSHVASWVLHNGPVPKGQCVCHTCDNRRCVNPDHLWLGTLADNFQDMRNKGRGRSGWCGGELHGNHKLTTDQVKQIRTQYAKGGISQFAIAVRFGVCERAINLIIHRVNWKHI